MRRFKVIANDTVKEFKELEDACKNVKSLENLGYGVQLWINVIGLYSSNSVLIYATNNT